MKELLSCIGVVIILVAAAGLVVTSLVFLWNLIAYFTAPWIATTFALSTIVLIIVWLWNEITGG